MLFLRLANKEDCKFLFLLRNEQSVRKNSFNERIIDFNQHCIWFNNLLIDKNKKQYIFMLDNIPIGQVRIDINNNQAELSYSITTSYQNKGFGEKIITSTLEKIKQDLPNIIKIIANVKANNIASQKIFIKNHFKEISKQYEINLNSDNAV